MRSQIAADATDRTYGLARVQHYRRSVWQRARAIFVAMCVLYGPVVRPLVNVQELVCGASVLRPQTYVKFGGDGDLVLQQCGHPGLNPRTNLG